MTISDIEAAASKLSELIDAAQRGEDVVITRDGAPVARLVPERATAEAQPRPRRVPGRLAGQMIINDPDWDKPDPELEALFNDTDKFLPRR